MTHIEARELASQFGSRMCDENGDTHGEELYCFSLDDIIAIKEALAQPSVNVEQEPIFLIYDDAGGWIESNESEYRKTEEVNRWLLYTTPPKEQQSCDKRPWVSLTDAEMFELSEFRNAHGYVPTSAKRLFARIEAKLKALNT